MHAVNLLVTSGRTVCAVIQTEQSKNPHQVVLQTRDNFVAQVDAAGQAEAYFHYNVLLSLSAPVHNCYQLCLLTNIDKHA
jgi:hypothetical protein